MYKRYYFNVLNEVYTTATASNVLSNKVKSVKVFPNPFCDILLVEGGENKEYTLINTLGVIVKQGTLSNGSISTSSVTSGVYILSVGDTNIKIIKK